jgi:hypothetical protein
MKKRRVVKHRARSTKSARTRIRVLKWAVRVNTGFGGVSGILQPGDRVEVGGLAANRAFLIAHRVQRLGEGWALLGPYATVPINALASTRKEELKLLRGGS